MHMIDYFFVLYLLIKWYFSKKIISYFYNSICYHPFLLENVYDVKLWIYNNLTLNYPNVKWCLVCTFLKFHNHDQQFPSLWRLVKNRIHFTLLASYLNSMKRFVQTTKTFCIFFSSKFPSFSFLSPYMSL